MEVIGSFVLVSWLGDGEFDLYFIWYMKVDELDIEDDEIEEISMLLEELEFYIDYIFQIGVICGEEIVWSVFVYFIIIGVNVIDDLNLLIVNYKVFFNLMNVNVVLEFNMLE